MSGARTLTAVVPFDPAPDPAAEDKVEAKPSWDTRQDAGGTPLVPLHLRIENTLLVALAALDNALCYVTYYVLRSFDGRLYNIVDLHILLLPGIDTAILIFALLGTLCFVLMIAFVECLGLPFFHELMNARLLLSALPCGIICTILVCYCEDTEYIPFVTLVTNLCFVFVWCLHMRVHYSSQLNLLSKIALDVSWFLAFVCGVAAALLYAFDGLKALTNSEALQCPFAENVMMPVQVLTLNQWYCAVWGASEATEITRLPANNAPAKLSCSDSFVGTFGASIESFMVECPAGCLRALAQGALDVVGCGTYAVDSSICASAIHAGVLTDTGGQATVYGRLGVPKFERCSRNSVVSRERQVTQAGGGVTIVQQPGGGGSSTFSGGGRRLAPVVPNVVDGNGVLIPQAFHFNMGETREYLWLKSFEEVSSRDDRVEARKPWTRIDGVVSLRLAGIELKDEEVRLGESERQPLFQPPQAEGSSSSAASSSSSMEPPPECTVQRTGVLCRGAGGLVLRLDLCQPEVMSCLGG